MAGIYDWILNSLRSDQSPAANQFPSPIPAQNLSGLPVPFQDMPSETSVYNPFTKPMNLLTRNVANPYISQDMATTPSMPNDPLRTYQMLNQRMPKADNQNNQFDTYSNYTPPLPTYNPMMAQANPMSPTRRMMIMNMMQNGSTPQFDYGDNY